MAKEKTLDDLFLDTLKDIYYAERKISKALPKMERAAQSPDLKAAMSYTSTVTRPPTNQAQPKNASGLASRRSQ